MAARMQHQIRPEVLRAVIDHILRMQGGKVPSFAYGGIVRQPTLAMVGDNGPEAMVPLRGIGGALQGPRAAAAPPAPNQHFLDTANYEQILAGKGQGVYGPNYLRDLAARGARMTAENARHRTDVFGRLAGLTPMQQRQALVNSEIGASADIANQVSGAGLQGAQDYQDFVRRLLGNERDVYNQLIMGNRANEEAARERRNQRRLAGLGVAGGVVGAGLGALR